MGSCGVDVDSSHRFRGEDPKKSFCCIILGFATTFTSIFVLERKFAYAKGAQSVFLGGTGLEMRCSCSGASTLFWCKIFTWGAQFLLGGGHKK